MPVTRLTSEDESEKHLADRLNATKQVQVAPEACCLPVGLAEFIVKEHEAGTQTLVVLNRVVRARETYDALLRAYTGAQPDIRLLHSRFRGAERKEWAVLLNSPIPEAGRILVATQVIEAGVDISSSLMVSDLAPYSSMVQRFGRCNRDGKAVGARIFWVDRPLTAKQARFAAAVELTEGQHAEMAAPYEPKELAQARTILSDLTSASPKNLKPLPHLDLAVPVVRMRDIVGRRSTRPEIFQGSISTSPGSSAAARIAMYSWHGGMLRRTVRSARVRGLRPMSYALLQLANSKTSWTEPRARRDGVRGIGIPSVMNDGNLRM